MTISSIIHKELLIDKINILWTNTDNKAIEQYIKHNRIPINFIDFEELYYGISNLDLVVCNNRIAHGDKCVEMCLYYHCPLVIIDYIEKPDYIGDINTTYIFEPVYQIALSESISNSWNRIHNKVVSLQKINDIVEIIQGMSKEFIKAKLQIENKENEKK